MSTAKPSPFIIMDLVEALDTEEVRLEVNRCYPNVGTVQIRSHETPEGHEPANHIRLMTLFGMRSYLDSEKDGADELWNGTLRNWYRSILYKLTNQMKIYNRRQRDTEGTELNFKTLTFELQDGELDVEMVLDSNSDIALDEVERLTQVRELLNNGTLGEEVKKVAVPSLKSYEEQAEAGMIAKAEREAAAAAEEEARLEAERQAAEEAEQAAEEAFLESPELSASDSPEKQAEVDLEALGYEIEKMYSFPEADFAINYDIWTIEYADGSTKDFDSRTKAFV